MQLAADATFYAWTVSAPRTSRFDGTRCHAARGKLTVVFKRCDNGGDMPRSAPPPLSLVLTCLRAARGWKQKDLAQAAGMESQAICDLEKGARRTLKRE